MTRPNHDILRWGVYSLGLNSFLIQDIAKAYHALLDEIIEIPIEGVQKEVITNAYPPCNIGL